MAREYKNIVQHDAETILKELIRKQDFIHKKWGNKFYTELKLASPTEKGNVGEDFLAKLLKYVGAGDVNVIDSRRGNYDVGASFMGKSFKFEVKVATEDTNNSFQFNGVRYDTKYTHLFCLGIMPTKIGFFMIAKPKLDEEKLVPMQKGTNATFKLTKKCKDAHDFSKFLHILKDCSR